MELEDYVRVKVADKVRLRLIIRDVCQHFRRFADKENDKSFYRKIQKLHARLGTPALGHAPNTVGYVTALLDEYGVDLDAPAPFAAVEDRHAPLMVKVLFDPDKPLFVIIISTLNLLRNAITAAQSGTSALLPPRFTQAHRVISRGAQGCRSLPAKTRLTAQRLTKASCTSSSCLTPRRWASA